MQAALTIQAPAPPPQPLAPERSMTLDEILRLGLLPEERVGGP